MLIHEWTSPFIGFTNVENSEKRLKSKQTSEMNLVNEKTKVIKAHSRFSRTSLAFSHRFLEL